MNSVHSLKQSRFSLLFLIASCMVLLITACSPNDSSGTTEEKTTLFQEFYEPYPNVLVSQERGSGNADEVRMAFAAYDQGKYETAVQLFFEIPPYIQINDDIVFYKAQATLAAGNYLAAKRFLLLILDNGTTLFKDHAEWYLALIHLHENNVREAQTRLARLEAAGQDDYLRMKASQLMERLIAENGGKG